MPSHPTPHTTTAPLLKGTYSSFPLRLSGTSQTTVLTVLVLYRWIATRCVALSVRLKPAVTVASMEAPLHHTLLLFPRLFHWSEVAIPSTTPQQSQMPTGFQQPGPFRYVAPNGFVPSTVVDSTTPPHVAAMSVGTPSPSVEVPATFYTHGSAISFSNDFGDPAAVHGLTTDLHFVGGDGQALGSNYSIRSVALAGQNRVRQTVINDARMRYSGVMPSAGHFVHASGRLHVEREATESTSQWSQWIHVRVCLYL
jgi:hypothetical protein